MTTSHTSLYAGLLVGLSVAVPIGPVALLCIQRTLASGMRAGVSTGVGAATVNVVYGALILLGLEQMGPLIAGCGRVLGFASGLVLLWSAARTLLRRPGVDAQGASAAMSPLAAYGSAVAFNAANPLAPIRLMALLSPVAELSPPSAGTAAALLFGMFAAACAWWVVLNGAVSLLRSRLSPRMLASVNQVSAAVLTLYGALAIGRAAGARPL